MKTYTGELKDGMIFKTETGGIYECGQPQAYINGLKVTYVRIGDEWQRYEPKPKKVWGVPDIGQVFYSIMMLCGVFEVIEEHKGRNDYVVNTYLDKHTAEQVAKAMNYINKFRALSDVPVDGKMQWYINCYGVIQYSNCNEDKLEISVQGYVANSREKAEQDLAAFPKIALAHKIVTWGFHGGIVEEVL